jgi:Fe(3+) dicitrate transport protein
MPLEEKSINFHTTPTITLEALMDGENGRYKVRNSHVFLEYAFTENTKLSAEYTNMDYAMQQSGLTDDQFKANARQSFRERNWLGTPWNLVALNFD